MTLQALGHTAKLDTYRKEQGLDSFDLGRVISEHRERYVVKTASQEYDAELIGNLRFTANSRADFPAVGDWVAINPYDEGKALIHALYPRHSLVERQAVGTSGQIQIIAANIDFGLIIQAVDRDFNLNRLERYLTICNASNIEPIVVLNKVDLVDESELNSILSKIHQRLDGFSIICTSSLIHVGFDQLKSCIEEGKTYCLLGSSGVGKSTIINILAGHDEMKTSAISDSVSKGRHTTTYRQLIVLENGGILIDNPGMREVGITDVSGGLEATFDTINELSNDCKFKDCTHTDELGCAVLAAVENEEVDRGSYNNYQKMIREKMHFESSVSEKRKKDKDLGKLIKNVKKSRKQNKF